MSDQITIHGCRDLKVERFTDEHAPIDRAVTLVISGNMRSPSDGYHTFQELYDHRVELWIALVKTLSLLSYEGGVEKYKNWRDDFWRSKFHSDGSPAYEGWFVLGIGTKPGEIMTYHVPMDRWEDTNFAETLDVAHFDGHTSQDMLKRLKDL